MNDVLEYQGNNPILSLVPDTVIYLGANIII